MELAIIFIVNFIITWSIGLSLPLVIRFLIVRNFLNKGMSITISVIWYFVQAVIFYMLNSQSKTHNAIFLTTLAGYYILRSGCKKNSHVKKHQPSSNLDLIIKD